MMEVLNCQRALWTAAFPVNLKCSSVADSERGSFVVSSFLGQNAEQNHLCKWSILRQSEIFSNSSDFVGKFPSTVVAQNSALNSYSFSLGWFTFYHSFVSPTYKNYLANRREICLRLTTEFGTHFFFPLMEAYTTSLSGRCSVLPSTSSSHHL